jgi:hypothetical protein
VGTLVEPCRSSLLKLGKPLRYSVVYYLLLSAKRYKTFDDFPDNKNVLITKVLCVIVFLNRQIINRSKVAIIAGFVVQFYL